MTRSNRTIRPTYAGVTATLALVVALAGTSYAAVQLNGRDIKRHSIPGNRMQQNAVVPAAKTARTTDQLVLPKAKKKKHGRAEQFGGVIKLSTGDTVTLFRDGQFTVRASCLPNTRVELTATSTAAGWYNSNLTGLNDHGPHPAGATVTIFSGQLGGNAVLWTQPAFVLIGANGDALHVGPIDFGLNALGADCVVSGYAVAS